MPVEQIKHVKSVPLGTPVWRYMNLHKYRSLLDRRALFFSKIAKLREMDPLEGSIPRKEAAYRKSKNFRDLQFPDLGSDRYKKALDNEEGAKDLHQRIYPQISLASCWHMRQHESVSMWERYAAKDKSIAVRSTVQGMINSMAKNPDVIYYAPVRYVDYENDIWFDPEHYTVPAYNFMIPNIIKSIEYEDEQELRLIYRCSDRNYDAFWNAQESQHGLFIQTDLEKLVHEVVLAPGTTEDDKKAIEAMNRDAGLFTHLRNSSLDREPIY